uniref:Uncharacterized protein n=1 Tax=Astyanax mexicanus TaxID=7994 RepID=A0A3B1IDH3_ASTMX
IYAIDLMLKWEQTEGGKRVMQPQLLEVNFSPDCHRACLYHPSFYDHMFPDTVSGSGFWYISCPTT